MSLDAFVHSKIALHSKWPDVLTLAESFSTRNGNTNKHEQVTKKPCNSRFQHPILSLISTNSRRSSESGGDSDSSDKRAPGCERRDWEREWGGDREQERQEEMDRLTLQSTSTSYSVDYNHKKLLASKGALLCLILKIPS